MADFNYQSLVQEAKASGTTTDYEPLPAGDYNVVVEKAEATNSKKGDPQLVVTFVVQDGVHAKRKLWHRLTFIPGNGVGLAINFRQLDALGATPLLEQGGSLAQVAGFLTGKSATVAVKQREWNGKMQNDVSDVKKGSAVGLNMAVNSALSGFSSPPPAAPAPADSPF
jgi:hypothetical protein